MNKVIWSAVLFFTFVFSALSQETSSADVYQRVPFTPIDQGHTRYSREGATPSVSADTVITDPATWTRFWEAHTQGREPRPELPYVDFNMEMVIVSALGTVSKIYEYRGQGTLHVIVEDSKRSDSSPETTTPFQIIKTGKFEPQSVVFHHPVTGDEVSDGAGVNTTATEGVQTQDLGMEAVAPSCVNLRQWRSGNRAYARVTNNCPYPVRLRIIWAWAPDTACYTLPRRRYWLQSWRTRIWPLPWPYVSELRRC